VEFFDLLAASCQRGLDVFAGDPQPDENIQPGTDLKIARYTRADNRHFSNPQSIFYRCWQENILQWLADWDPDVLIVEANPRYPTTFDAVRWMKTRRRPVIGWGLGAPLTPGLSGLWRSRQRKRMLASLDGMIAYSQHGAQEYRELGFPEQGLFVATNAVNPKPGGPIPDRPSDVSGRLLVLFVGRLQPRKRVDDLLHACAALPNDLQPRLSIIGDGPARQSLEKLARQVYPAAEFPGARYGKDLDQCFAEADLFVLPGTGGLAIQQAMSFGLPVIVAEGDGTQGDLVREGNGWIIPDRQVGQLSAVLKAALSDVPRLREMGAESYRIVEQEINLEAMVSVFVEAMNKVAPAAVEKLEG
jgi:glycosyltransferase involved in cell wall biosynthesis